MSLTEVLSYLFIWGLIGIVVFSVYVIVVFRTGIVYTARKDDGTLKKNLPMTGILLSGISSLISYNLI